MTPLVGGGYTKVMKRKPVLDISTDAKVAQQTSKVYRWNYCQAIARELYRSDITNEQLREVVQSGINMLIGHTNP